MLDEQKIIERFISYVKIDSQSNADSEATPSTKIQWDIANKLVQDLKDIGLSRVSIDKNAYIYATLPSNIKKNVQLLVLYHILILPLIFQVLTLNLK